MNGGTGTSAPTQTWLRPVTTCVCKPEAANTVRAPDDARYAARNMLSLQWTVERELQFPLRLDYGRSPHVYVNQRQQIQLELLMMSSVPLETCWAFNERWNNKFCYKVASCWLFLLSHILFAHCLTVCLNYYFHRWGFRLSFLNIIPLETYNRFSFSDGSFYDDSHFTTLVALDRALPTFVASLSQLKRPFPTKCASSSFPVYMCFFFHFSAVLLSWLWFFHSWRP